MKHLKTILKLHAALLLALSTSAYADIGVGIRRKFLRDMKIFSFNNNDGRFTLAKWLLAMFIPWTNVANADTGIGLRAGIATVEASISRFWDEDHITSLNYMAHRRSFPPHWEKTLSVEHSIAFYGHWFFDAGLGVINRKAKYEICRDSSVVPEGFYCFYDDTGTKISILGYSLGIRYLRVYENWYWEFVPIRGTRTLKIIRQEKDVKLYEYDRADPTFGFLMFGIGINI